MEVVVGTYNHVLFGFTFQQAENEEGKAWKFKPLFTDQGHSGCIKSVSTGGRYLASGSTDETIRLFDMKKHVEVGTLVQQDGSITSLVFCGTSHMLSGSDDGTICIWKSKSWELEKTLKGHKGSINSISLHPSGRLALSVSKDKSIKTWNLLTGRPAYTTNLKEVGEIVCWSPKGDAYAVVVGCRVTVYKINGVHDPVVYTTDKSILAMTFINDSVLLLAGELKEILLYDFEKKLVMQRIAAHKIRTKAIKVVSYPGEENKLLLFTVASDGNLKAWTLNKEDLAEEASFLAGLELPGRPTCLTVKLPPETKKTKPAAEKEESHVEEKVDVEEESAALEETDENEDGSDASTEESLKKDQRKSGKKNKKSSSVGSVSTQKKMKKKKNVPVGD